MLVTRCLFRGVAIVLALIAGVPLVLLAAAGRDILALRLWCGIGARALGVRVERKGPPPPPGALIVCNHVGYLDILALGAAVSGRFVAKSEIARWPLVGPMARAMGTIFVERDRPRAVRGLIDELAQRLSRGERILLFPEAGVNPEGVGLRAFRSMLFEASLKSGRPCVPAALAYIEPEDPRVWAWIEEPSMFRHLRRRVVPAAAIRVELRFGEPLLALPGEGRKAFAERARCEVLSLLQSPGREEATS